MTKQILAVVLFTLVGSSLAEPLYILDEYNSGLHRIDTQTIGAAQFVGTIPYGDDDIELVGATPTTLYTFDRASNSLVTVSTLNASVVSVITVDRDLLNNPRGFDLGTNGTLYGVFDGLELRSINTATGVTSLVTTLTGVSTVEALAFASDGTLYATGAASGNIGNQLYTVNLGNGAMSLIGGTGVEIDTLGFGDSGALYGGFSGPGRRNLYSINLASGAATNLGDTGIESIVGIARPVTARVPVPGTLALFWIGAIVLRRMASSRA